MDTLSEEQQTILNHIKNGQNVVVDAVAGTGKTTLILSTAQSLPDKQFLQMTYNSMLRCEVKEKISALKIPNINVHTFHSLAVRYYMPTAHTDTGIRYILYNKLPPITPIPKVQVMVLDEAQDMTLLYFQLMSKFIFDMGSPVQLFILGDYMQGLYEFKGADIRFLTFADLLWKDHPLLKTPEFQRCTMKMSYRITNQMCSFVNQVLLGEDRMQACRSGQQVTYIRNSRYHLENIVTYEISELLKKGVKPSDIFVLGASVKGMNSNIRKMENVLVERNIPCHVPMFENDKIDERVIDGKVVFSTFHCVKGRQRKYVFVMGFDNSYFTYNARTAPRNICPNTIYVACTRATTGLYLLESDQWGTDRPMEFLKRNHHEMKQSDYIRFKGNPQTHFFDKDPMSETTSKTNKHYTTPTELIKFIPESVIEEISPIIDRIFVVESTLLDTHEIDIPIVIETDRGFYEDVSDLNGIAIPSMYYDYLRTNSEEPNELFALIDRQMEDMKANQHAFLKQVVSDLPRKLTTIEDYLYLANVSVAVQERLYFKLKQIGRNEYTWLTDSMVAQCRARLDKTIGGEQSSETQVELTIIRQSEDADHERIDAFIANHFPETERFRFTGRVDLVTDRTVWELKCTSKISMDHLLQVVIYAWLWRMTRDQDQDQCNAKSDGQDKAKSEDQEKVFKILNIKTGEIQRLDATMEELNCIMVTLLRGRYAEVKVKTDEEFMLGAKIV